MFETSLMVLAAAAIVVLLLYFIFSKRRKSTQPLQALGEDDRTLLSEYVSFYKEMDHLKQAEFEGRLQHFLSTTRITGVNTKVERLDELLIAASAIIPIFGFRNWEYMNLNEVLLYPTAFDERFNQEGDERTTLGVVGDGPYQNVMILSQQELRQGFINKSGKNNTAIHEFVHLIDKTDGAVDGVPEFLMNKQYVLPWLQLIHQKIEEIRNADSDINPYGATNQAEFFAVVSEYFFERPDLLQEKHPQLYDLLTKIFNHQPLKDGSSNAQ